MKRRLNVYTLLLMLGGHPCFAKDQDFIIPVENQAEVRRPELGDFAVKAKRLLDAIEANQADAVLDVFFPELVFRRLKAIAKPDDYYRQLIIWYKADIAREHERLKIGAPWSIIGIKETGCRWKKKGSEANNIPYWSCFKTRIALQSGARRETLEVRSRINWGQDWFITHLGPIPKTR